MILNNTNFIYSGCCKKKTSNGGNKSSIKINSTGSKKTGVIQVKKPKDTNMPVDSDTTKPGDKLKEPVPPSKPTVTNQALMIETAIKDYINARDWNRSDLAKLWTVVIMEDMSCTITNGFFTGTIAGSEINTIENLNNNTIKNLEVTIKITRQDGITEYKFDNNKRTLENLRKSLNVLKKKYRNEDNEEYLYVDDSNRKIFDTCYINLSSGLLYIKD